MKLVIVIAILAFCYCGSYANVNRCIRLQPSDMDPQLEGHMNPFQPRLRRDESGVNFWEDPEISNGKQKVNEKNIPRPRWRVGSGFIPPVRTRSLPKSRDLHILQEYIKEEPDCSIYGDYDGQD